MPIPAKVVAAFKRKYGDKKGKSVFYAMENKNPEMVAKMVKTAKKHKDKMVKKFK